MKSKDEVADLSNQQQAGDTEEDLTVREPEPVMTYEDAAGNVHQEPACPRCIERYSFQDRQKEILLTTARALSTSSDSR